MSVALCEIIPIITIMKEVKMGMGRRGMSFLEDGRVEIAWPLVCR